jgi:hypothetical protein
MKCPACNKKMTKKALSEDFQGIAQVHQCPKCRAVFGTCYLGESYEIVKPYFSYVADMATAIYYDLTCLGSNGIERRHGWFDPTSKLILQTG